MEEDIKKIKRYIEIIENRGESFEEIMERIEKWEKEKEENKWEEE